MQKGSALKVVVLVVAIVIIVLALWMSNNKLTTTPTTGLSPSPTASSNLSVLDQLLKADPGSQASSEQLDDYYNKVLGAAINTNTIDVTRCSSKPAVVKVKEGSTITFVNQDSMNHRAHHAIWSVDVPANGQINFKTVGSSNSIFGYLCDGNSNISGILVITK